MSNKNIQTDHACREDSNPSVRGNFHEEAAPDTYSATNDQNICDPKICSNVFVGMYVVVTVVDR